VALRITASDYDTELLEAIEELGDGAFDDVIVRAQMQPASDGADPEWRVTFAREATLRKARSRPELRELVRREVIAVAAARRGGRDTIAATA
jgi:hypothetical protein